MKHSFLGSSCGPGSHCASCSIPLDKACGSQLLKLIRWLWQTEIINRLSGGGASGRAAAAAKALEKIKGEEAIISRPFVPKKRSFAFPSPERMGQRVLEINGLTHGYGDRALFDRVDLEIEKGERVAVIGALPSSAPLGLGPVLVDGSILAL